jgi:superfamily II DNA helicase RecQ
MSIAKSDLSLSMQLSQLRAVQKVAEFAASTKECRRKAMLKFFGENFQREKCVNNFETICDNCLALMSKEN